MKAKSKLKVVDVPGDVLQRLHEARVKHEFMNDAITNLWGNEHTEYGQETMYGAQLFMNHIGDELFEILKGLDPKYERCESD